MVAALYLHTSDPPKITCFAFPYIQNFKTKFLTKFCTSYSKALNCLGNPLLDLCHYVNVLYARAPDRFLSTRSCWVFSTLFPVISQSLLQSGVIDKLAKGALHPILHVGNIGTTQNQLRVGQPLEDTTANCPVFWVFRRNIFS